MFSISRSIVCSFNSVVQQHDSYHERNELIQSVCRWSMSCESLSTAAVVRVLVSRLVHDLDVSYHAGELRLLTKFNGKMPNFWFWKWSYFVNVANRSWWTPRYCALLGLSFMPRRMYHIGQGCKPNPAGEHSVTLLHRTEFWAAPDMYTRGVLKVCKLFRVQAKNTRTHWCMT